MGQWAVFATWGRAVYHRRRLVLAGWALVAVAGAVLGGQVFDRTSSVDSLGGNAESVVAERRIEQLLGEGPQVIAIARGRHPRDPALVESLIAAGVRLQAVDGVVEVRDGYTAPGGLVGADNNSLLVQVELAPGLDPAAEERVAGEVATVLRTIDAPQVLVGGEVLAERAFAEQAIRDATVGESIALVVLFLVLVLLLGGVAAATLPVLVALGAVATTLLALLGLAAVTPVSEFAVNVVTLLGIGLAVDYTLLLVFRFREERAGDPDGAVAGWIGRTVGTAGRTVLISGLAVAAAMAGLWLFAAPLLASMAQGGLIVVLLATAIALTAVPALLGVAHRRIPPPGAGPFGRTRGGSPRAAGLLGRLAGYAYRRPGPVAVAVTAGLLLLALPFAGVNLANSDARALPRSMEARQAYDVAQRDFLAGRAAPVVVLVEADPAQPAMREFLNDLLVLPQVARLELRVDLPPGVTVIDLTPPGHTGGPQSRDLVRAVRALPAPLPVLVAGPAAEVVDHADAIGRRLPAVAAVLLAASAVLLFLLTGSLVIPVKALLLNLLTLGATLGVLVAVFQWGWGAAALGVEPWGAIDLTTPVLLFVFLFGLTMDYEVFLLARITEAADRGAGAAAVVRGIAASGPVVTAAAACMVIVFLGFVLGELAAVKEVGVGMVVAIVLDVTVVRGLLLPAVMALLGRWNWWAPAPLRRWHGRWSGRAVPAGHDPAYTSTS
jgi:RND superfamily putative drug exporter